MSVTVVVPSHERPERLRALLDALAEQTLADFDVVVVHDSAGEQTDAVLAAHPLRAAERLRWRRLAPGTGRPGRQREVGWRLGDASLVAFVDDDCRPAPGWLAELVRVAEREPGAIVQGRVVPDPLELDGLRAAHHRTLRVEPPGPFAQTANILYPRAALEQADGFVAHLTAGEDTDLALRCRAAGWRYVGAPEAVVHHAVEVLTLGQAVRGAAKWADLAYVVRKHPELRAHLVLRVFWRAEHAGLLLGAVSLLLPARLKAAGWAPYLWLRVGRGRGPRAALRATRRLPGALVVDVAELVSCARGSVRHRTPFL